MNKSYKELIKRICADIRLKDIDGSLRVVKRKIYRNFRELNEIRIEIRFLNNTPHYKSSNMYCVYFQEDCELIKIENSINKIFKLFDNKELDIMCEYIVTNIMKGEDKNDKEKFNFIN